MDNKDAEVIYEVYSKMMEINDIVRKSNMENRVVSAMIFGIISSKDLEGDKDTVEMQSVFDFNIVNEDELATVINAMIEAYNAPDDLDDLLSGLNISLN